MREGVGLPCSANFNFTPASREPIKDDPPGRLRPRGLLLTPPLPSLLVLDGEQRSALAVVRSLGRRGCQVHVGSWVPRSLAGGSRFARSERVLPDPLRDSEAYRGAVAALVARLDVGVVLPVSEASTLALLQPGTLPPAVIVPTSSLAQFHRACDKAWVLQTASTLGISVPSQWTLDHAGAALPALAPGDFPLVIKPSRSVVEGPGGRRKLGVGYAANRAELDAVLTELGPEAGPVLLQQRIEGPGMGVFFLRWNGRVLATFAHRRIREKPPSGGVSVCCESVSLAPSLRDSALRLLDALDWNGVAMVEFKQDRRSGQPYLMEINPRFWGSLQLAVDAGVDFPWLLLRAALGLPVEPVERWQVGVRSRWALGDLDHLIARLRRSPAELHLPADALGTLATALTVLNPWRPRQRGEVCRLSDPRPAWREAVAWVRELA